MSSVASFYVDSTAGTVRGKFHRAGYGRLFASAMSLLRDRMLPLVLLASGAAVALFLYRYFTSKKQLKFLENPEAKYSVPLLEKKILSHDTRRFRFKLPSNNHRLGLPIGQHINLITKINDELVIRAYTPVSSDDDLGYFDLVIKVYFKNTHPKFPDGGKMTQHLETMNVGDCIDIRGPNGLLQYTGFGNFRVKSNKKDVGTMKFASKVGMIAGGSGLTPMYQLIKQVLKTEGDKTELWLIYANQTPDDILCRDDLEAWACKYPDRFKIHYTVDRPAENWSGGVGFVSADMIKDHLPPPGEHSLILMCGPPPMIKFACKPNLDMLGYSEQMRFAY